MITSEKSGVWDLSDVYNKDKAGYWNYSEPPGLYYFGNVGLSNVYYSSPVQIPGTQWSTLGSDRTAIKNDGTLWVWGDNSNGNLSLNDVESRSSPTQIPGTQWVNANTELQSFFATKTDGTLWMSGDYLGTAGWANNRRSSPTQIPGTNWNFYKLSKSSSSHFNAINTDGELYSWGYAYYGYLGLNQSYTTTPFGPASPQKVGTNTTWVDVKSTWRGGIATKTDGTLWAWGGSNPGTRIIPWNSTINYSSPVQIPGTSWNKLGGDNFTPLATKTDGTLWSWGANYYGELGINGNTGGILYSSPTQIPGTQWDQPIDYTTHANINGCWKTDGTLWVWGYNGGGRLGLNDTVNRSSPHQVPGNQWNKNYYTSFNLRITA